MVAVAAGRTQANLTAGVAFLGVVESTMSVDDPSLGQLAQPVEWLALVELGLVQRSHRLDAHFLQHIFDFELSPQSRAQLPLDKRQQRPPYQAQILSQCG